MARATDTSPAAACGGVASLFSIVPDPQGQSQAQPASRATHQDVDGAELAVAPHHVPDLHPSATLSLYRSSLGTGAPRACRCARSTCSAVCTPAPVVSPGLRWRKSYRPAHRVELAAVEVQRLLRAQHVHAEVPVQPRGAALPRLELHLRLVAN